MSPETARDVEALRAALRQSRGNLLIVALMWAALAGACLYAYFAGGRLLEAEEEKLLHAGRGAVAAHAEDLIEEIGDLAADSFPPLERAFADQLDRDFPEYVRALESQGDQLARGLERYLAREAKGRYQEYVTRSRAVLQDEFPEVTDPRQINQMMDALKTAVDRLAERYYVSDFRTQTERLAAAWKSIPPAEPGKGGDQELQRQFLKDCQYWLLFKIAETESQRLGRGSGPVEPERTARRKGG